MKIRCSKGSRRGKNDAFTLVEVVVAAAVILTAFAGIFAVTTMGLSISEASRENLRATQIMLDKMEGLRLYSWSQVTNSTYLTTNFTNWFYETNNVGLSTATGYGTKYTGTVAVSPVPFTNGYSSSVVQVTVAVNWTSSGRGWAQRAISRSRSMTTYFAEQGLQNYVYNSSGN